jgi:hypothetical protein
MDLFWTWFAETSWNILKHALETCWNLFSSSSDMLKYVKLSLSQSGSNMFQRFQMAKGEPGEPMSLFSPAELTAPKPEPTQLFADDDEESSHSMSQPSEPRLWPDWFRVSSCLMFFVPGQTMHRARVLAREYCPHIGRCPRSRLLPYCNDVSWCFKTFQDVWIHTHIIHICKLY